jgi:cell wall-associated NlpC family hydrolase
MHLSHSFRVAIIALALATTAQSARADESAKFVASDGTSTHIVAPSIASKLKAAGQKLLDRTETVGEYALGMLGIQYKFGGNSPDSGFDCSGLVRYVFAQVTGLSLPHNAAEQSKVGREISMEELRPGDLVFFNTRKFSFSHVGIYLGDNKFVHAPRKGKAVEVVEMGNPYWAKAYNGARRLLETAQQGLIPQALAATTSTDASGEVKSPPAIVDVFHAAPEPKTP